MFFHFEYLLLVKHAKIFKVMLQGVSVFQLFEIDVNKGESLLLLVIYTSFEINFRYK